MSISSKASAGSPYPQSRPDPSLTSNTATIGLSKNLVVPITIKLCYLQPSKKSLPSIINNLASSSDKYSNPLIFKKLSNVSINSELLVEFQVFDGNNNPISIPVTSNYKYFTSNRRIWNTIHKLPVTYNQVSVESYIKFTIFEIIDTKRSIFGVGYLSIFNKDTSTVRKGSYKVAIHTNTEKWEGRKGIAPKIEYGDIPGTTDLEQKLINYENGEYPRSSWLDKLSLSKIEKERSLSLKNAFSYDYYRHTKNDVDKTHVNTDDDKRDSIEDDDLYYIYIELPNFELPIVYSDETYQTPNFLKNMKVEDNLTAIDAGSNTSVIINSMDIPMLKTSNNLKVYDPDFDNSVLQNLSMKNFDSDNGVTENTNTLHNLQLDPIEVKYHKLERNINNNSILDKELKPTPQIRDELLRILQKPSNIELTDVEKNLIWKFRYYFSKNNSIATALLDETSNDAPVQATSTTRSTKLFLTKFLKSINWDNDYELDHAFNEIIPNYWTVDKIQIGDALELLSSYFNPYTLTSELRRRATNTNQGNGTNHDQMATDESKFRKVFKYVIFLRKFAVDRLRLANGEELLLYLLQLVQALKYESVIFEKSSKYLANDPLDEYSIESGSSSLEGEESLLKLPLATFLIDKSIEIEKLGNFFYWYVKVENEDQINSPSTRPTKIYSLVLNRYIESLKRHSSVNKLPNYNHLKRQIWFIKKLTNLVELLRTTFKKNEATAKKVQFLREYLADASNELLKFPEPFPLPLDPSVIITGCYPNESSVFKSSLAPLKITFKTIQTSKDGHSSQIFGRKNNKYGKFPLMFKIGDDLRQDQLVIQIINLMDQLLKNENLDLRLTPYKILATSPIAGLIQFVPNDTLDTVLSQSYPASLTHSNLPGSEMNGIQRAATINLASNVNNELAVSNNGIMSFLKLHSRELQTAEPEATSVLGNSKTLNQRSQQQHAITSNLGVSSIVMDNYVKSCAGYCVITYLLGVGDRHLDNLLLSPNGKFWHADFGYILGRDPKPFPPLMKLPIQVIDGMGGLNHENFNIFKSYCFITYTTLRKNSNLILNLFQLMLDANIPDIKIDPKRAVEKVQEKFCLEMTEEEAILHFQNLINDSVNAFLPVVIDRLHSLAQYWRA